MMTQGMKDALADAETLRRFIDAEPCTVPQGRLYRVRLWASTARHHGANAKWHTFHLQNPSLARDEATNAARAAFRAVPALREE